MDQLISEFEKWSFLGSKVLEIARDIQFTRVNRNAYMIRCTPLPTRGLLTVPHKNRAAAFHLFGYLVLLQTEFFCTRFVNKFPLYVSYALFHSKRHGVKLECKNFTQWPPNVYLAVHHRADCYKAEVLMQFLPFHLYQNHSVITALGLNHLVPPWITHGIFREKNINVSRKVDTRFFALLEAMSLQNTIVTVFPDRNGSAYLDDYRFFYRPGLFAASLYHQVPIVDLLLVEPTDSVDVLTVEFYQWDLPTATGLQEPQTSEDTYALWRSQNASVIEQYTRDCEDNHKRRLRSMVLQNDSCTVEPKFCYLK